MSWQNCWRRMDTTMSNVLPDSTVAKQTHKQQSSVNKDKEKTKQ
jgi:hypothetical protein